MPNERRPPPIFPLEIGNRSLIVIGARFFVETGTERFLRVPRNWMKSGANDSRQRRLRQSSDISWRTFWSRHLDGPGTDCLILIRPRRVAARKFIRVRIRGYPTVYLMKGGLSEQDNKVGIRKIQRATESVKVHKAAAG